MKTPQIVETDGSLRPAKPEIDIELLITRAKAATGVTEEGFRKLVHEIDRESVKAGQVIFNAIASDEGAKTLWDGIVSAFFSDDEKDDGE